MIKTIIEFDYYLAKWFASSSERIIPGTSFLFLNQVSFMVMAIYSITISIIPLKIKTEIVVLGIIILIAVIMYGFQKPLEKYIYTQDYNQRLILLDDKQYVKKRIIGLLLFIFPIIIGFVSTIMLLGGYSNR